MEWHLSGFSLTSCHITLPDLHPELLERSDIGWCPRCLSGTSSTVQKEQFLGDQAFSGSDVLTGLPKEQKTVSQFVDHLFGGREGGNKLSKTLKKMRYWDTQLWLFEQKSCLGWWNIRPVISASTMSYRQVRKPSISWAMVKLQRLRPSSNGNHWRFGKMAII